ncbi:hypothetical protein KV205_14525 [Streptomyces sp. SKN60]|uniref:hypothetical protein n=1 Tax=Streptomyces sp. SKN60 TaxID=2855506 RepID=UPI0022465548|nr:hypothetical protein [Streptomyces sp. SKN60]MCX2181739.1 hypothetical protein [Streptomyces sp. SKN60]
MRNAPVGWAALPLLLAALAGCQSGGGGAATDAKAPKPTGTPVYEVRLDDQLSAASRATTAAGSSAFTWTLSYGSAKGTAVDRTTGTQDYAKDTARAERVLDIPRRFPEDAAADLGGRSGAKPVPEVYEVKGNQVDYRTRQGGWLRYSSQASMDVVDLFGSILVRAGDAAPFGGTLAEVVRNADAEKQPTKGADGSRTYELSVPWQTAYDALPASLVEPAMFSDRGGLVSLTVVLDGQGRLTRTSADYTSLLKWMHEGGVLKGVTSLKAEYTLTGHGSTAVPAPVAAKSGRMEDAEKALTPLAKLKPGACGSADTGLGVSLALVRTVPCGKDADLRVFGQVKIKETIQRNPTGVADKKAGERCRSAFRTAPDAWVADARPAGTYFTSGSSSSSSSYTGPDVEIAGDFTCYVQLSAR